MLKSIISQEKAVRIKPVPTAFLAVLFLLLFLTPRSVKADSLTWSWSISGSDGLTGSGTLTTSLLTPLYAPPILSAYYVTEMSGQFGGFSVALSTAYNSTYSNFFSGRVLETPSNKSLWFYPWSGLYFTTSNGQIWRLYGTDLPHPGTGISLYSYSEDVQRGADVGLVQTPEPSALALLSVGLISFLGLAAVKKYLRDRLSPVRPQRFQFQS